MATFGPCIKRRVYIETLAVDRSARLCHILLAGPCAGPVPRIMLPLIPATAAMFSVMHKRGLVRQVCKVNPQFRAKYLARLPTERDIREEYELPVVMACAVSLAVYLVSFVGICFRWNDRASFWAFCTCACAALPMVLSVGAPILSYVERRGRAPRNPSIQ